MSELARYLRRADDPAFRRRERTTMLYMRSWARYRPKCVLTSWGKDAIVLVHLARRVWGDDVTLVHLLRDGRTESTFADCDAGALIEGVEYRVEDGNGGKSRQCIAKCADEFQLIVDGARAQEHRRVASSLRIHGRGLRTAYGVRWGEPIADWLTDDVWTYIAVNGLRWDRNKYEVDESGVARRRADSVAPLMVAGNPRWWYANNGQDKDMPVAAPAAELLRIGRLNRVKKMVANLERRRLI